MNAVNVDGNLLHSPRNEPEEMVTSATSLVDTTSVTLVDARCVNVKMKCLILHRSTITPLVQARVDIRSTVSIFSFPMAILSSYSWNVNQFLSSAREGRK